MLTPLMRAVKLREMVWAAPEFRMADLDFAIANGLDITENWFWSQLRAVADTARDALETTDRAAYDSWASQQC